MDYPIWGSNEEMMGDLRRADPTAENAELPTLKPRKRTFLDMLKALQQESGQPMPMTAPGAGSAASRELNSYSNLGKLIGTGAGYLFADGGVRMPWEVGIAGEGEDPRELVIDADGQSWYTRGPQLITPVSKLSGVLQPPQTFSAGPATPPMLEPSPDIDVQAGVPNLPRSARPSSALPPYPRNAREELLAAVAQRPLPQKPGLLRNLLAAGVGGAAAAVNARGRVRIDPATTQGAIEGIKYPGYAARVREYQKRLDTAKLAANMEQQQEQDELRRIVADRTMTDSERRTIAAEASADYQAQRAAAQQRAAEIAAQRAEEERQDRRNRPRVMAVGRDVVSIGPDGKPTVLHTSALPPRPASTLAGGWLAETNPAKQARIEKLMLEVASRGDTGIPGTSQAKLAQLEQDANILHAKRDAIGKQITAIQNDPKMMDVIKEKKKKPLVQQLTANTAQLNSIEQRLLRPTTQLGSGGVSPEPAAPAPTTTTGRKAGTVVGSVKKRDGATYTIVQDEDQ